jgi:phospholipid N-methyltransferase
MDPFMAKTCREKFPDLNLIEGDAIKILHASHEMYDNIVSGIPFAALPKSIRHPLFIEIAKHLKPGGTFVMFQYSLLTRRELNTYFTEVKTKYTPFNIPPAFVFVAKGKTK